VWRCGPARGGPPHAWGFWITHNDAPKSVGLLWTSDQLVAETSTWQHTTLTIDKHPCLSRIRTHNLSRRAATDPRLRPLGNWDRPFLLIVDTKNVCVLLSPHCTSFSVILYLAHTVLLLKVLWGCITRMARSHSQLDAESQIILSLINEAYRTCPSTALIGDTSFYRIHAEAEIPFWAPTCTVMSRGASSLVRRYNKLKTTDGVILTNTS